MIPVALRYSARNLLRGKGRNLLVILLTAPVFLSMLLMLATAQGLRHQVGRLGQGTETLIQIRARRSFGHINQAGGLNRTVPAEVEKKIVELRHVMKVEPYLVAIEPIAGYYMTLHTGVRADDARRLATHGEVGKVEIVAGRDLRSEDEGKDVALLGLAYARKMGITPENFRPGESVFMKDILRNGEPGVVKEGVRSIGGRPFRVAGLFSSGYAFGDNQMFMPYETFRRHYGVKDRVSKLFVRVDKVESVPKAIQAIRAKFPGLDVSSREDGARFMSAALATMRRIAHIWVGLSIALAGLVMLFAVLLTTDERMTELGVLKSLGASSRNLAGIILGESFALSVISAGFGGVFFALFGGAIGRTFFKATLGIYLPGQYGDSLLANMPVEYRLSSYMILALVLAGSLTGLLGSLYALWQVNRLSPLALQRT